MRHTSHQPAVTLASVSNGANDSCQFLSSGWRRFSCTGESRLPGANVQRARPKDFRGTLEPKKELEADVPEETLSKKGATAKLLKELPSRRKANIIKELASTVSSTCLNFAEAAALLSQLRRGLSQQFSETSSSTTPCSDVQLAYRARQLLRRRALWKRQSEAAKSLDPETDSSSSSSNRSAK